MVAWTVEAELQLLLLALKQAPKFVIDSDQIIAEWAGADKPTIRSVRDRFNMIRRKSGGNNINVANGVASTPASATTPAPGSGSAKHKTPTASSIVTPSKNGLADGLGTSKTNGYTASGTGVATKDTIVIDDITFPLTPTPTTETKKSRRRSYNRRPPGSNTAFIDMNPAHFPGPPGSSPASAGEAAIKSETQESKAANMSEGVNGVLAATPGSIGEGSAVKAGISTPSKSKLKLKENANGESIGNGKINGKTNARNTAAANSITNSNSNSNAKSITKPNSITTSGSLSGSGSRNGSKKRKASHLFPSSSSSNEDGPGAISSDADSDSVSEFESESKYDTSRDEISGDEIVTPSKSMFHINSSASTNNSGKGNCKGYGKGNEYTTTTTPTTSTVTATTRKPLPRRSKSSTLADAYTNGGDHGNTGVDTGGDADEKLGVLGDMNGVKDGVGVGGVAGLDVADGDGIGSGVGGDMSDDETDLDFNIDADIDFDVNADDEMDFNIDVDEKEWFGEMGFDAKGKAVGKASGDGKGKIGNVNGNGGGKGKGKRGWRERVSKFQV